MSNAQRQHGLAVPSAGAALALAAGVTACCIACFEWRTRSDPLIAQDPLPSPFERLRSIEAIVETEPEPLKLLVPLLADQDAKVRRDALIGLGRLGPDAGDAIQPVRECLSDESPEVRDYALSAFSNICEDHAEVCSLAARSLADPLPAVRDTGARILRNNHADAIPALAEAARTASSPAVRGHAARLMEYIDGQCAHPQMIETFRVLARDDDLETRLQGIEALSRRGLAEIEETREWLQSDESAIAECGLLAVGFLGPERSELLPVLLARLEKTPARWSPTAVDQVRVFGVTPAQTPGQAERGYWRRLIEVLASFKSTARPAASALLRRIASFDAEDQFYALGNLLEIGAEKQEIARIVLTMQETNRNQAGWTQLLARTDPNEARRRAREILRAGVGPRRVSDADARLLCGFASASPETIPWLIKMSADGDGWRSRAALDALGELGPAAGTAVPALVTALEQPNFDAGMTIAVIAALGKIGPAARAAIPLLLRMVNQGSDLDIAGARKFAREHIRVAAVEALGRIGEPSPAVRAAIVRQLARAAPPDEDRAEHERSRVTALHALFVLGAQAPDLHPELRDYLDDSSPPMRLEAVLSVVSLCSDRHQAVDLLIRALDDEDLYIVAAAALGLGELAADATAALPKLRLLADRGQKVCLGFLSRLRYFETGAEGLVLANGRDRRLAQLSVSRAARMAVGAIETGWK